jgi:hypothetical protein
VRRALFAVVALAVVVASGTTARADDDDRHFRLTTPRGSLTVAGDALVIGIPGGRAWGVESELRALPASGTRVIATVAVRDDAVREAFIRVAYYASATGRSRQIATVDSAPVTAGARRMVGVEIEPPRGAVAYRVRVLARLREPGARSADDAVTAVIRLAAGLARPMGSLASRLLD